VRALTRDTRTAAASLVLAALLLLGCAGPANVEPDAVASPSPSPAPTTVVTGTPPASATVPVAGGPEGTLDARAVLEPLVVDDGLAPGGYLRDLFPTWKDIDDDGCDARRPALIAASSTPAQTAERCAVISGSWTSAYDGATSTDPADIQIDHVVPLANAWRSGAHAWTPDPRVAFANDQAELWAVSAASNQSKGDRGPEQWRPPRAEVWCEYARRWTAVKVRWNLTVTTAERDALGQMLDTC
jgi:hypothetical protein